jgi:hypothetical protein
MRSVERVVKKAIEKAFALNLLQKAKMAKREPQELVMSLSECITIRP